MPSRDPSDGLPHITNNPLPLKPPFEFGGLSARVFPLRANMDALQQLCDRYLNFVPPEVGQFRAVVPYVYLALLDYGRLSERLTNLGWFAQKEVFFCVPVEWYRVIDGEWIFQDWAVITPFIFVDDDFSVPLGRTVFGWPKACARLAPTLSRWMDDPLAAVGEATVQTMVFPELYEGRKLENRIFLEIERESPTSNLRFPAYVQSPILPWMIAANLAQAVEGFGRDGIGLLKGLGVFPMHAGSNANNFAAKTAQMVRATDPRLPGFHANTMNLKQFRDSELPNNFCYQALTNGRLSVTSFNGGGVLGEERVLAGDLSGGYSIRLHKWPSLPIVELLGLEVNRCWRAQDADVALLKPVMPFWTNVDMVYHQGINLAWRTHDGVWRDDAAAPIGSRPKAEPASDEMRFNTTVGQAVNAVAGPFRFSGTTIRVLPLIAQRETLEKFLDSYLNSTLSDLGKEESVRFSLWAGPTANGDLARVDDEATGAHRHDYAYVYLTATSFRGVTSKTNNVGDWAQSELSFLVPVKWERRKRNSDKWEVVSVGLVPAYTFVDDTTAAAARSEVLGIPTTRANFVRPESAWMMEAGAVSNAPQQFLCVNAEVLPVVGEGQRSEMHPIVELSTGGGLAGVGKAEKRDNADRWARVLIHELERKKKRKAANKPQTNHARALALELLANRVPFVFYTLKQFRDVTDPDRACYQSIVRTSRVLEQVLDIREFEQTVRVRIYDFPTLPLVESLGIVGKTVREGSSGIVYVTEAVRPFTMRVTMDEELGERLLSRAGTRSWRWELMKGERQKKAFRSLLSGNTPITVGRGAEDIQDQGDPRRMEQSVQRSAPDDGQKYRGRINSNRPLGSDQAVQALQTIDPQMIIESILSREWGNWDENARWRSGRRELTALYEARLSGVSKENFAQAETSFFATIIDRAGHRPGEPPIPRAQDLLEPLANATRLRLELESAWEVLVEWGVVRLYGARGAALMVMDSEEARSEKVRKAIKEWIVSLDLIAKLKIEGQPGSPDDPKYYESRDTLARLKEVMDTALSKIKDKSTDDQSNQAIEEAWLLRDQCQEMVKLARARCFQQRDAVLNKLAKAWQKPDFCVRRDAAGSERDRQFPRAESWDDDWYYGPRVPNRDPAKK